MSDFNNDSSEIQKSTEDHEMLNAVRNFRWAYRLLLALAKKLLDEANAQVDEYDRRQWKDMNESSRSIWLHKARELAGINHEAFLGPIRSGHYRVSDIYYADEIGKLGISKTD